MKKLRILSVVLAVVMLAAVCPVASAQGGSFGSYERVVIIGVDGAGAFFDDTDTPSCDRIFSENSAVTNDCRSEIPTISAQNWGAILLGVTCDRHGLTNDTLDTVERDSSEKYPSVFRIARETYPDAVLASFCDWSPINYGLIENDIGVYKANANDEELTGLIEAYLPENDPKLMFVHFDSVDGAGHSNGYGSAEHLARLTVVDGFIGRVYDKLDSLGRIDDTLFIVVADHGGTPGGSHGGATSAEKTVFLGVKGKNVTSGTMENAEVRDVAAIALHALGCEQPEIMTSRVPAGVFADCPETARPLGDSSLKQLMDIVAFLREYLPYITNIVFGILAGFSRTA